MDVTTNQLLAEIGRLHVECKVHLARIAKLTQDNQDVARELAKLRGGAKRAEKAAVKLTEEERGDAELDPLDPLDQSQVAVDCRQLWPVDENGQPLRTNHV